MIMKSISNDATGVLLSRDVHLARKKSSRGECSLVLQENVINLHLQPKNSSPSVQNHDSNQILSALSASKHVTSSGSSYSSINSIHLKANVGTAAHMDTNFAVEVRCCIL